MGPPLPASRALSPPRERSAASKRSRWSPSSHAMETCGFGSCKAPLETAVNTSLHTKPRPMNFHFVSFRGFDIN